MAYKLVTLRPHPPRGSHFVVDVCVDGRPARTLSHQRIDGVVRATAFFLGQQHLLGPRNWRARLETAFSRGSDLPVE